MGNIYKGTLELIGNTPLVEVTNIEKLLGLEARVFQSGRKCKGPYCKGNDRRCREPRTFKGRLCHY